MANFHALSEGQIRDGDKDRTLTVHDLGVLRVPSGKVEASDPFVNLGQGVVVGVPPGDYPVRVTVADVSDAQDGSHLREAYLSLVLTDRPATRVELAHEDVVPVDAGTVAFADADAVRRCMPDADCYEEIFDDGTDASWFSRMDDASHLRAGCANIVMPLARAGENVVLSHSGWGDGLYPVIRTLDSEGNLTGLHIDLLVVGDEEAEVVPGPPTAAPVPPGKPSRLRRLFGA